MIASVARNLTRLFSATALVIALHSSATAAVMLSADDGSRQSFGGVAADCLRSSEEGTTDLPGDHSMPSKTLLRTIAQLKAITGPASSSSSGGMGSGGCSSPSGPCSLIDLDAGVTAMSGSTLITRLMEERRLMIPPAPTTSLLRPPRA